METTPSPEMTHMPGKKSIKSRRKLNPKAYEEQLLLMFVEHPPKKGAAMGGWPHLAHGVEKSYDFSR